MVSSLSKTTLSGVMFCGILCRNLDFRVVLILLSGSFAEMDVCSVFFVSTIFSYCVFMKLIPSVF